MPAGACSTSASPLDNVIKYLGPGFQLVSFDPKTTISMVGREAFAFEETLELAADLAASDRFCGRLHERITDRAAASGDARPLDADLREQIDTLMMLDDEFRVWGTTDGTGLVIRSDEPVDFHPINTQHHRQSPRRDVSAAPLRPLDGTRGRHNVELSTRSLI